MNGVEKFPENQLLHLREELMQAGLDQWQAGELIREFLAMHGYGVSHAEARTVAMSTEPIRWTAPRLQTELARIALVM